MNKREQQRAETLEKIRSTVDELVQEVGFEKMTIRQICERAGVAIGGFYHYFKTKDDLLFDRYARGIRAFEQLEEEVLCKLSPLEALRELNRFSIEYTDTRVADLSLEYHAAMVKTYQQWKARLDDVQQVFARRYFVLGCESGEIRSDYSPEELAGMFFCMSTGYRYAGLLEEPGYCRKCRLAEQIDRWLCSLRNPEKKS